MVIELNPIGQVFGVGPLVPVVGQYDPHPITKDMGGVMTLFPLTRSVEPAKALPKGVQASPLAQTSRQSWGETDKNVFQTGKATPDPGEKTGPLPVAVVATVDAEAPAKAEGGEAPKKAAKARMQTSEFVSLIVGERPLKTQQGKIIDAFPSLWLWTCLVERKPRYHVCLLGVFRCGQLVVGPPPEARVTQSANSLSIFTCI